MLHSCAMWQCNGKPAAPEHQGPGFVSDSDQMQRLHFTLRLWICMHKKQTVLTTLNSFKWNRCTRFEVSKVNEFLIQCRETQLFPFRAPANCSAVKRQTCDVPKIRQKLKAEGHCRSHANFIMHTARVTLCPRGLGTCETEQAATHR